MQFLSILLLLLCCMVTGHAVSGFLRLQDKIHVCGRIGLYFGVGTGTQALLVFYASLLGVPLSAELVFIIAGCFLPFSIWFHFKYLQKKNNSVKTPATNSYRKPYTFIQVFFLLLIVVTATMIMARSLLLPMHLADDRANWGFRAKIYYHEKSVVSDDFTTDHRLIYQIKKHPPFVPVLMSLVYFSLKQVNDTLATIPFPLFYAGLLMFFYAAQRQFASRTHSLIFTTVLALQPIFIFDGHGNPASGYADIVLTFYFFAAAIGLLWWIENQQRSYLLFSALCITFCLFTKKEGTILWLILFAVCFVLCCTVKKGFQKKPGTSSASMGEGENQTTCDSNSRKHIFPFMQAPTFYAPVNNLKFMLVFLVLPLLLMLPFFNYIRDFAERPWEKEFEFSIDTILIISGNIDRIPSTVKAIGFALFTPLQNAAVTCLCVMSLYMSINRGFFCAWSFFLPVIVLQICAVLLAVVSFPHPWWGVLTHDMSRLLMPAIPLALYCASESLCFSEQNDNTITGKNKRGKTQA